MSKPELHNLVRIGQIKAEPASRSEFAGLVESARKRLADARNESLSAEADLIWRTTLRMRLRSQRCAGMVIAPTIGTSCFKRFLTRWAWTQKRGEFLQSAMALAIWPNTRDALKLMNDCWLISSNVQYDWRPPSQPLSRQPKRDAHDLQKLAATSLLRSSRVKRAGCRSPKLKFTTHCQARLSTVFS